jgi:hypothetical protein
VKGATRTGVYIALVVILLVAGVETVRQGPFAASAPNAGSAAGPPIPAQPTIEE